MIKDRDKRTQRIFQQMDLKNRQDYVQIARFKRFTVNNFSSDDELVEFDPATVTTEELSKVVATIIKEINNR